MRIIRQTFQKDVRAGAGDRLGLIDESSGDSVPTAMLPYCGRTLLEGLVRDLQVHTHSHGMQILYISTQLHRDLYSLERMKRRKLPVIV